MNARLIQEASRLERELNELASKEKGQYKKHVMVQTARLLRDILNYDEDEPHIGLTDDF